MKTHIVVSYMPLLVWFLAVGGTVQAAPPVTALARPQESTGVSDKTATVTIENRLGEMIAIPAGSFMMGNNGHEGFGGPEELPQHLVDLPAYRIGKYEVTRGQFRKFREAGGYEDSRYWSTDGWKWKESDVISESKRSGRQLSPRRQPLWVHGYGRECLGVGCRVEQVLPGKSRAI